MKKLINAVYDEIFESCKISNTGQQKISTRTYKALVKLKKEADKLKE